MDKERTKLAVQIFDKYAETYQTKYMDISKYHQSLDIFYSSLPQNQTKILELSCGPGNITKYLITKDPTLNILATDLSPAMLRLAQENNPSINVQLMDCRSVLELKSTFDAIICGFGLPYISKEDSIKLIKDASISLNEGGLLYLSTMEDDYTKSRFIPSSSNPNEGLYMYFHEADYLTNAMESSGFKVIDISRVTYIDAKNENVTDLIIIGKL